MANKHYETKLKNTITKSIGNQIILTYLNLLQSTCIFAGQEITETVVIYDEDINKIVEFIKTCVKDLENIMSFDGNRNFELSTSIEQHQEIIVSKYKTFCSYLNEYNTLLYSMEEVASKKYLEENPQENQQESLIHSNFNNFLKCCYEFIKDSPSENENRIVQLLKYIPMNMTKEKYFDYIRKALEIKMEGLNKESITKLLEFFRGYFNSSVLKDSNLLLPKLIKSIDENIKSFEMSLETKDSHDIFEFVYYTKETLQSIYDSLDIIHIDLNYLLVLIAINLNMDFIAEKNPIYIDLYRTLIMIMDEKNPPEDRQVSCQNLIDSLQDNSDEITETQMETWDKLEIFMEKYDEKKYNGTELGKLVRTNNLIETYICDNLEEEPYVNNLYDDNIADQSFVKKEIEDFIEFLRDKMQSMDTKKRKKYMQNFITKLPPIWQEKETINYIKSSLENCSQEIILLTMFKIENLIRKIEFDDDYDEDDYDYYDFEFDEDYDDFHDFHDYESGY